MKGGLKRPRLVLGIGLIIAAAAMFAAVPAIEAVGVHSMLASSAPSSVSCSNGFDYSVSTPSNETKKVLSLSWKAVNDEDSGLVGYWAMDTYSVSLSVWQVPGPTPGTISYFVIQTFSGNFQVPQGALSPENGVLEPSSGYGSLTGLIFGYIVSPETFDKGSNPSSANLGDINYGGNVTDVLLGSYTNGQVGDLTEYNWYTTYFTPGNAADFPYQWGFTYLLNSMFQTNPHGSSDSTNEWCNWDVGNYGDIVTAA